MILMIMYWCQIDDSKNKADFIIIIEIIYKTYFYQNLIAYSMYACVHVCITKGAMVLYK